MTAQSAAVGMAAFAMFFVGSAMAQNRSTLDAYHKQVEERRIEGRMRGAAKIPPITDVNGCVGRSRNIRQESGYSYRYLHACPNGVAEGSGLLFKINSQGVPDSAYEGSYLNGVEISRYVEKQWVFLAFGSDYWDEPARFFGNDGEWLQRSAVGGGLIMVLIQSSHKGSAEATQALQKLMHHSNDAQLSKLQMLLADLPEIDEEARQTWLKRVNLALAPNDNKATCQKEVIADFVGDFLRVVKHVATTGGQYDWLHYQMRRRVEHEANEGDALTRDLREAEAKKKLGQLRDYLRSSQHVKGKAPSFECGFTTVWRDKLRSDAFDGKRLSLPIGSDYLGRKQGLQPVRLDPPTHLWTEQILGKTALMPKAAEFGYNVFAYPFDPICRFPNGCMPIQSVEFEPVTPEQARAIRAISQSATGGRLGVKTIGTFEDGNVTRQKVERLIVYNPDNPAQQLVLTRVQMKASP